MHILFTDCHFSLAALSHDRRALPLFVWANCKNWKNLRGSCTMTPLFLSMRSVHKPNPLENRVSSQLAHFIWRWRWCLYKRYPTTYAWITAALLCWNGKNAIRSNGTNGKKREGSQVDARLHWSHKDLSSHSHHKTVNRRHCLYQLSI